MDWSQSNHDYNRHVKQGKRSKAAWAVPLPYRTAPPTSYSHTRTQAHTRAHTHPQPHPHPHPHHTLSQKVCTRTHTALHCTALHCSHLWGVLPAASSSHWASCPHGPAPNRSSSKTELSGHRHSVCSSCAWHHTRQLALKQQECPEASIRHLPLARNACKEVGVHGPAHAVTNLIDGRAQIPVACTLSPALAHAPAPGGRGSAAASAAPRPGLHHLLSKAGASRACCRHTQATKDVVHPVLAAGTHKQQRTLSEQDAVARLAGLGHHLPNADMQPA